MLIADADRADSTVGEGTIDEDFVVLVPVSNPRSEAHLVSIAAAIANQRNGRVIAITIVQVPDQTPLEAAREQFEHDGATDLLAGARRDATALGAPIETHTVFSHRLSDEVYDSARRYGADVCVIGWGAESTGVAGRTESLLDELAEAVPCDFLVFKDRGFDPSRILLPTSGGPHSALAALVANMFRAEFASDITLLHVAETEDDAGAFLGTWAREHHLEEANQITGTGDIEAAIRDAARGHTMVLIGATEAGVLSRLARGSLTVDVLEDVNRSLLIVERKTNRGLIQRLFGRQ